MKRLFFDMTYTKTQVVNVGITRTVRRLQQELARIGADGEFEFVPVVFHKEGFREADSGASREASADAPPKGRLFRSVTSKLGRQLVLATLYLPWPLVRLAWSESSSWMFSALSRSNAPVGFRRGDVLMLCDASWNYPVWRAAAAARSRGARVVLMMYDLIPLRHPTFCFQLVPSIFKEWLHQTIPVADAVVCISRATQDDLCDYAGGTGLELPPAGFFHLGSDPVGVADAALEPGRLRQFIDEAHACFAAIGSFEPKKNYGFLLEVFERVWAGGSHARLLIAGRSTPECAELIARMRSHPEQGRRLLTLFDATDGEIAWAYAKCRALLFPSLAEGFGLPLVEARSKGCLVIASDLPAFVELADEGVAIYERHSAAALEKLILEHISRNSRGEIAPMRSLLWKDSARQCLAAVEELLGRPAAHADI